MGTLASTESVSDLRELADPEFFVRWADVRNRLALTRTGSIERAEAKRRYEDVAAEYQRRVETRR